MSQQRAKELLKKLESEGKVIPGTYDKTFKYVMTNCKDYLASILTNFIDMDKEEIKKNLVYKNTELLSDNFFEKSKTTDIVVEVDNMLLNLEMNRSYYEGLSEKNEAYLSKLRSSLYYSGEGYANKMTIQINFDNFQMYPDDDIIMEFKILNTKKYYEGSKTYRKYHINLEGVMKKYYNKEELDYLEKSLLIICLDELNALNNVSRGDDTLMEVKKNIEDLSKNLDFLLVYDEEEEREKRFKTEKYYAEKKGMEKGIEKGRESAIIETAKNLIDSGVDLEIISKSTGLSVEALNKLKNS